MGNLGRRELLKIAGASAAVGAAGTGRALLGDQSGDEDPVGQPEREPPGEYDDYEIHRVNADGSAAFESISGAVEAASERDLVLVEPGVYAEIVRVRTPRVTVRGTDRNEVILDGGEVRANGIYADADGVVVENLTVRNYTENGVYWTGVDGYRGSYLTAHNNGQYGIYALGSVNGRFDNCYASGHPDSGFYIGECDPCHAVIEDVVAERNGVGYSGTNAGGALTVRDSVWRHNLGGIVPNTLDSEGHAPQSGALFTGNEIRENGDTAAPVKAINAPTFGCGVVVAGGTNNRIVDNTIEDHANFGVVVAPMYDDRFWQSSGNVVRSNDLDRSGRADLALAMPEAGGNCFADNDYSISRPPDIEGRFGCEGRGTVDEALGTIPGDLWPTLVLVRRAIQGELGSFPGGDWTTVEPPGDRPGMPDPLAPPREPVGEVP